ncbi:response regulator transcription factor [Frankia sp. AgB1.9]|uniref:response regulator n=1 Tax=unclassified Frankia TaxID=2632575 RepID=UPI0019342A3D|nr:MULTISPECIES: response regulator transcription factor [unclassified Frankia]MBL7492117.1 response regulator transcription factor [Frankia sp. AgW1.1]MBL7551724.1 response regulator transcription factor [Frankia sp. AgB1.9]MBL7623530.1 response regulator transcription factor [Frankia sp. AgB1.8]
MTITVLLVDDQPLLRMGFRMVIESQPDLKVVGEAGDGAAAAMLAGELSPDVVVMDVRMPGVDGIEATRRIAAAGGASRVLILTTFDLDQYVLAGLRAGASGFLLKDVPPADLLTAIRTVAAGDAVVAPNVTRRLLDAFAHHLPDPDASADGGPLRSAGGAAGQRTAGADRLDRLTDRERDVLGEVAAGLSNAEIAARLVLSDATVKTHVGRILAKLELRDRVQAVVFAYETGLIRPSANPPRHDG